MSQSSKIRVEVEEFLEPLMDEFFTGRRRDIENLEKAIEAKDRDQVRKIGHILYGVCGSHGFDELGEIGRKLENEFDALNEEELKHFLDEIKNYIENADVVFV